MTRVQLDLGSAVLKAHNLSSPQVSLSTRATWNADSDKTEIGGNYLSEFDQNWPTPCDSLDHPADVHFLIYALLASCADENGHARPSVEQLAAWSSVAANVIEIALENLCDEDCGIIEEIGSRAAPAYRVCHLSDEGEPISVPNSLLRDPSITPAAKRAAIGALLNGQDLRGRASDGSLLFSIPNSRSASPDALIELGRRQLAND